MLKTERQTRNGSQGSAEDFELCDLILLSCVDAIYIVIL